MKRILFLMVVALAFAGCNGGEELKIETSIWYYAKTQYSGNNKLTATFCFFKDGDYDPTTFEYKPFSSPSNVWEDATIKTTSGEIVKSFFIDIVLKSDSGTGTYNCSPGNYYVAVMINSNDEGIIWKAEHISVTKNKITMIDPTFKDTYTSGYVNWNE